MWHSKSISCIQFTCYCRVYHHSYQTSKKALIIGNWASQICLKPLETKSLQHRVCSHTILIFLLCANVLHAQNTQMTHYICITQQHTGVLYSYAADVEYKVSKFDQTQNLRHFCMQLSFLLFLFSRRKWCHLLN